MAQALKTMAVQETYRHGFRQVSWSRQGRRWLKRQANRAFRHTFNRQLRDGRIEAWTDFDPSPRCYCTWWDVS